VRKKMGRGGVGSGVGSGAGGKTTWRGELAGTGMNKKRVLFENKKNWGIPLERALGKKKRGVGNRRQVTVRSAKMAKKMNYDTLKKNYGSSDPGWTNCQGV